MTDTATENQVPEPDSTLDEALRERLQERLLDQAHATQLKWCLSRLEHRVIAQFYRHYFKDSINASYLIVRMPWHKVTAQHILNHLEALRKKDLPLLKMYVSTFLETFEKNILDARQGIDPEGISDEARRSIQWLVEGDLSEEAQASALTSLSEEVSRARNALSLEQQAHQLSRTQLEDQRKTVERLQRELSQAAERTEQQVRKALKTQAENSQKELTHAQLLLRRERDAHQRTVDQSQARIDELQHEVSEQQQVNFLEAYQQVRDLKNQLVRERADAEERRTRLHKQQQATQGRMAQLLHENAELREITSRPALDDTLLQGALIVDYERLASSPLERFLTLFNAYRDALQHRPNAALEQASNLSQLKQEPTGILVLGLERLLEDGANLPLERYLRTRIFQQESKLHHLIEGLGSPRLEVNR